LKDEAMFDTSGGMPFDTISMALRGEVARLATASSGAQAGAVQRSGVEPAAQLAAAAWMAVVSESWTEAHELARLSLQLAHEVTEEARRDGLVAVCAGLNETLDLLHLGRRPSQEVLDRLARLFASGGPSPIDTFAPMLEIPNWFTYADRYRDAGQIVDRQLLDARLSNDEVGTIWALGCRAELDVRRGRWGQASAALDEGFALSCRLGLPAGYLHVLAARLASATGSFDEASTHLAEARTAAYNLGDTSTQWRTDATEGFMKLSLGDLAAAAAALQRVGLGPRRNEQALAAVRLWDADLVEALIDQRRVPEAEAAVRHLDETSAGLTPWQQATSTRCAALLATTKARAEQTCGIDAALTSAAVFEEIGAPFEQARSHLVVGDLHRRLGYDMDAAAQFERAASIFAALGADPWERRARRNLCHCQRSAVTGGWELCLTDQERSIAEAVGSGLSNVEVATRLFISAKTVEAHLTRIYRKLNLTSRTQLAALVNRSISDRS
jgi:DNA-binding CsgD family transcriptional regulator